MREYGGNIHFIRLEAQALTFENGLLLGQEASRFKRRFHCAIDVVRQL